MTELHELLGRELDPIDDVRRRLEDFYTEDYFDPQNGDWISDDYWRVIDLSTQPRKLIDVEHGRLDRSITRLNEKYNLIQGRLGESCLRDAYNQVAEQVNSINGANPNHYGVPFMQSAPTKN